MQRLIDNPIPVFRSRITQFEAAAYNEISVDTGLSEVVRGQRMGIEIAYIESVMGRTISIGAESKTVELSLHANDRGLLTRVSDKRHFWARSMHINATVDGVAIELNKIDDLMADGKGRVYTQNRILLGIDSDAGSITSIGDITAYGWPVKLTSAEYLFYRRMYR